MTEAVIASIGSIGKFQEIKCASRLEGLRPNSGKEKSMLNDVGED